MTWLFLKPASLLPLVAMMACTVLDGCVTVDPTQDYQRARKLMASTTGVTEVFDPAEEELVDARVNALLADGLSVEEAVQVALLNNKGLQSLFQAIGMSRAQVVQSGLLSNPVFSFGVRFPEGGGRSELTAGLAQQIVDLWQIPVRKRGAEAQLERTVLTVARQAHELATTVRRSYYELLAVERALELAREHTALTGRSLEVAEARLDVGEADPFEVHFARSGVLDVEIELTALAGDRDVAELALSRALGLSRSAAPWTLSSTLPQPRSLELQPEEVLGRALSGRLDVQSAQLAVQAAESEFERQCRNVFPSIVVGITGERTERGKTPDQNVLTDTARASLAAGQLTAPSLQSQSERDRAKDHFIDALLGATITMTVPLWDQNQAQIASARYAVIQRRKETEDLLDQVAREVGDALVQMRSAAELASLYEQEVFPNDQANVEGARALYETGNRDIVALVDAQESMLGHRWRYVDALRSYAVALANLELSMGGPVSFSQASSSPEARP